MIYGPVPLHMPSFYLMAFSCYLVLLLRSLSDLLPWPAAGQTQTFLLKPKTFHGFLLPRVLLLSYNVKWNICFNLWKEELTSWLRFYWKYIPQSARIQIHGTFSVLLNTPTVQAHLLLYMLDKCYLIQPPN